jgi:hypothetical protein
MAKCLPPYAYDDGLTVEQAIAAGFDGMGNDILFDQEGMGFSITGALKSVGSAVKSTVTKVAPTLAKAGVNVAASKVGLGPIFNLSPSQAAAAGVVPDQQYMQQMMAPPPPKTNYTPWIIGGGIVGVGVLALLLTRRRG